MSDIDFETTVDDNQTTNFDDDTVDTAATCRSDDFDALTYMDHRQKSNKNRDPRLSLEARRQDELKSQSMINALNQFIQQAGSIYKGNKLSFVDETRLRSAASEVGVSTNVVDALLEQTGDRNAIMDYCMNSDDVFARKIKEDPQLSRILLRNDRKNSAKGDELNVIDSVWRIFMHKIIKQFLKEQNMELTDIIEKSAQTRKLYEETLSVGREKNKFGMPMIPRDYTEERKRIFITDAEAKEARREASEEMEKFQLCRNPSVYDLVNGASMQIHRELQARTSQNEFTIPDSRYDDLSMMPCATERESPFMPRIRPGFDPMNDLDVIPFLTKQDATLVERDSYCETVDHSENFVDSRNNRMTMLSCETRRESSVFQNSFQEDTITRMGIADDLDCIPCPPESELSVIDMNKMLDSHDIATQSEEKTPEKKQSPSQEEMNREQNEHTPKREVLQTITKSSLSESNTASAVKQRIAMYEKKPTSPQSDTPPKTKRERMEEASFPGGDILQALAKFEKKEEEPQTATQLMTSPQPMKNSNGNVSQARALFEKKDEEPRIAVELITSPQPQKSSSGKVSQARTLFEKKDEEGPVATERFISPQSKRELNSNILQAQAMFEKKETPHTTGGLSTSTRPKKGLRENISQARAMFEKKDEKGQATPDRITSPHPIMSSSATLSQVLSVFENQDEDPQVAKTNNRKRTNQNIQHVLATWTKKEQENPFVSTRKEPEIVEEVENVSSRLDGAARDEGGEVLQESNDCYEPVTGVETPRSRAGTEYKMSGLDLSEDISVGIHQVQVHDMQASDYNLIQQSVPKYRHLKFGVGDSIEVHNEGFDENSESPLHQNDEAERKNTSVNMYQESHSIELQDDNDTHDRRKNSELIAQKSKHSSTDVFEADAAVDVCHRNEEGNEYCDSEKVWQNNSFEVDRKIESSKTNETENIEQQYMTSNHLHPRTRKHPWDSNIHEEQVSESERRRRKWSYGSDVIDIVADDQNQNVLMDNDQHHSLAYVESSSNDSNSLHIHPLVRQQSEQSTRKEIKTSNPPYQESRCKETIKEKYVEATAHALHANDFGQDDSTCRISWTEFESNNSFRGGSDEKLRPEITSGSDRAKNPNNRFVEREVTDSRDDRNRLENGRTGNGITWTTFESDNTFQESSISRHGSDKTKRTKIQSALPDQLDSMERINVFPNDCQAVKNASSGNMEHKKEDSLSISYTGKMPDSVEEVRAHPSVPIVSKDNRKALDEEDFVSFNLNPFPTQSVAQKRLNSIKKSENRSAVENRTKYIQHHQRQVVDNKLLAFPNTKELNSRSARLERKKTSREEKKSVVSAPNEFVDSLPSMPTASSREEANVVSDKSPAHENLPLASRRAKETLARARKHRDMEVRAIETNSEREIHQENSWEFFSSDFKSSSTKLSLPKSNELSVPKSSSKSEHLNDDCRANNETGTALATPSVLLTVKSEQRLYSKTNVSGDSGEPATGNEFKIAYPLADDDIDTKLSKEDQCLVLDDNDSILDEDEGIKNFMEQRGDIDEENIEERMQSPERPHQTKFQETDGKSAERRHLEALGEFLVGYNLDDKRDGSQQDDSTEEWSDARAINSGRTSVDHGRKNLHSDQMELSDSYEASSPTDADENASLRRSPSSNVSAQEVEDREPRSSSRRKSAHSINDDTTKDRYGERKLAFPMGLQHQGQYSHSDDQQYPVRILDRPLLDLDDDEEYYDAIEVERQNSNDSGYLEPEATGTHSDEPQSYQMGLKPDPLPDPSPKGNRKLSPEGSRRLSFVGSDPIDSADAPEGATEEELKLLNHFIEVASSNFNGNTLSADSEARVRSAALKVGLTSKFVDQLLNQTMTEKEEKNSPRLSFIPSENPPPSYGSEQSNHVQNDYNPYPHESADYVANNYDDNGTNDGVDYYSRRTARERRRHEDPPDACNAWDGLVKAIGFFATTTAKACGMDYHNRRDDSSVVSALSWEGDNDRRRRRQERPRESTEPYVPNYPVDQEQHHDGRNQRVKFADCYQGGSEAEGHGDTTAHQNGGSSPPPRPKIRQLV